MTEQHTPTPWTVYDAADAYYPGIDAARRTVVVFGSADEECGVRGDTPEEAEANARFIVRAVNSHDEMLEALTLARTFMVDFEGLPETDAHNPLRIVDAAIAKARGEVA